MSPYALARRGRTFHARLGTREDAASNHAPLLTIAAKPLNTVRKNHREMTCRVLAYR